MADLFGLSNMDGSIQGLQTRRENRFRLRTPLKWQLIRNPNPIAPESVFPAKFLPVTSVDANTDDGIVIPMGVIVSLKNVFPANLYKTIGADTEVGIDASGYIPVGKNAYGDAIKYSAEDHINAYGDYQTAVLVVANGGAAVDDVYTAFDAEVGTYKASGAAAAAGDTYGRTANIPFGITESPVFADYRGRFLNSDGTQLQLDAPVVRSYIWVPYVIDDASYSFKFAKNTLSGTTQRMNSATPADAAEHVGYKAVLPLCGFLWLGARDGVADAAVDGAFVSGEYLASDYNGRFVPQAETAANALTQGKTAQTVGRLITLDSKFPRSLRGLEDTYPGSGMTGTDTAGLDKFIYEFVDAVLSAAGKAHTRNDVQNAVKSGRFGMATIEILPA